ncbi:hypothetical protein HY631_02455 [Candidatus Uhrbacteria bacterium]|nr:hypothetical protein [Candidatus Uhrbacteria bacterium]
MLKLDSFRARHFEANVFVEDGERAVCIVLYDGNRKAFDALRVENHDLENALLEVRHWIRSRNLERDSLDELLAWFKEEHDAWMQFLAGHHDIASTWLGSRSARTIPELSA